MKSVMILLANIFLPMLTTAASTTRYFDTTPTVPLREKDVFLSFDQLGQVRDKFEGLSKQLRRNHTIEVPKANQMLEQFVHLLKTFFSDTDFDRVGFAKQETNLRRKLSEITNT
ncbi:hypothetical protein JCM33374_g3581 [Metschnikowia sp. JCM 33374]|nr:hypothetical protein JCM33374_g3581 [Metschnikowia sp. JCM 33374]